MRSGCAAFGALRFSAVAGATFRLVGRTWLYRPMLKDKALASLAAGDLLLERGFTDDAASRYYYAMFQAAVHALTRQGWTPGRLQSGALEWGHVVVLNNVSLVRGRRSDRALFDSMRDLRVKADYRDDSIAPGLLAARVDDVRAFVEEVTA